VWGIDKLNVAQDKLMESRQLLPTELPSPLKTVALREFPNSKKKAMAGREAAEEKERDEARQRRRAGILVSRRQKKKQPEVLSILLY
jgi:hypothetical protein